MHNVMAYPRRPGASLLTRVMLLACLCPAARPQTSSSDTVYHLHGTVIDGVSRKPLGRALVQSPDQRLGTMTNDEGQFSVDISVPPPGSSSAGRYPNGFETKLALRAQKPGYVFSLSPTIVSLDTSLSATAVELKLMPTGSVAGYVAAEGAMAPGVSVLLLERMAEEGEYVWRQANMQTANARGEFRFGGLRPGEYTVMTRAWHGEADALESRTTPQQQYPPVFLGDARDLAAAIKIHLGYGETLSANLHLHRTTFIPISIPVAGGAGQVSANLSGTEAFDGYSFRFSRSGSGVEGLLPSGDYTLMLSSFGTRRSFAELPIHVAGVPVRTATVTLSPATRIEVRVKTQLTHNAANVQSMPIRGLTNSGSSVEARQMPPVQLVLRSADSSAQSIGGNLQRGPDGEYSFDDVPPGHYTVQSFAFQGYVASMQSGGVDLLEHPLVVNAGSAEPIDVVVRDDVGDVSGTVDAESDPMPQQTFLYFLPLDGTARYQQGYAGATGTFDVKNVAPGSYRVLAVAGAMPQVQLAYRDLEFLRRFETKGTSITVAPGQSLQISVPLVAAEELEDQ